LYFEKRKVGFIENTAMRHRRGGFEKTATQRDSGTKTTCIEFIPNNVRPGSRGFLCIRHATKDLCLRAGLNARSREQEPSSRFPILAYLSYSLHFTRIPTTCRILGTFLEFSSTGKRNRAEHKWNGLPACTRARCNRMAATAALRSIFARTGRKLSDSVFVVHKRLRSLRPIPLPASFILLVLQSPGCRTRGQAVSSQGQGGRWPKNYRCKTCNAASFARRGGGT